MQFIDNGIGKSSVLQAIALALISEEQLDKLDLNVLDYLKYDTSEGFVKIHSYEQDEPIELHLNRKGFEKKLPEAPTFVVGYGSVKEWKYNQGTFYALRFESNYKRIVMWFSYVLYMFGTILLCVKSLRSNVYRLLYVLF